MFFEKDLVWPKYNTMEQNTALTDRYKVDYFGITNMNVKKNKILLL